jgi:three-Cys-motif partner protein
VHHGVVGYNHLKHFGTVMFWRDGVPAGYDRIGPWSEIKLEILRKYAHPYSLLVNQYGLWAIYIDGFAGPGEHVSRTTGEPVPGSPLNALRTQPPFREYHFIDADPVRAQQLRTYATPGLNVHVHAGDCNDILLREVFPRARREDRRRALCLLDPYNIDLSWEVVATAGSMRSIELFVNFMVMDMNMNILLRDPEKADPVQIARMNRFWGDESWRSVAYEENPQRSLFVQSESVKVEDANRKIAAAYRKRLIDVAGFKYAAEPLAFSNSLGATIYYLFFASPNLTGKKIVEDIFAKHR